MASAVNALFFDVFGTLVDWRTSIAREAQAMLEPRGVALDWPAFADAWRGEYQGAMDEVRSGRIAFCKLDVLHRRNLDITLKRFGVADSARTTSATSISPGTGSTPGPTCRAGSTRLKRKFLLAPVSNGNISLMVDLARRNDLPWDAILGAEIAGDYKPKPRVYLAVRRGLRSGAGRLHDGGRAFERSGGRRGVGFAHCACGAAERAWSGPRRSRADRAGRFRGEES